MTARLLCKFGEMKGAEFDIDAEATIGRSQENTIVLTSGSISTEHARIFWDDETASYVIEDLDSLNGTQLDGMALEGRQSLRKLHVLNFGRTVEFIFVARDGRADSDRASKSDLDTTIVGHEIVPLPRSLGDGSDMPTAEPDAGAADEPEPDPEGSSGDGH